MILIDFVYIILEIYKHLYRNYKKILKFDVFELSFFTIGESQFPPDLALRQTRMVIQTNVWMDGWTF